MHLDRMQTRIDIIFYTQKWTQEEIAIYIRQKSEKNKGCGFCPKMETLNHYAPRLVCKLVETLYSTIDAGRNNTCQTKNEKADILDPLG